MSSLGEETDVLLSSLLLSLPVWRVLCHLEPRPPPEADPQGPGVESMPRLQKAVF